MQRPGLHISLVFVFILVLLAGLRGQNANAADSLTHSNVIFEDDFSGDSIGRFPGRWFSYPSLMSINFEDRGVPKPDNAAIREMEGEHVLMVHSRSTNIPLAPYVGKGAYLTDSFNVVFDAIIEIEESDIAIVFYDKDGNYTFYNRVFGDGHAQSVMARDPDDFQDANFSASIKNEWHHYRLEFKRSVLEVYIDDRRAFSVADFDRSPASLAIAANTPYFKNPFVAFRNFKITSGHYENQFNTILKQNKFVTHAILFNVNKADIKPSSNGFVLELANWLKQNPDIRLEIDGHTDNDGSAAANLKLSKDRADAVKKQLVAHGIKESRLSAKGFGATKPIQSNATPQGKESNRRVEFIKK